MQNSLVTAHFFMSAYAVAKWTLWTWRRCVMYTDLYDRRAVSLWFNFQREQTQRTWNPQARLQNESYTSDIPVHTRWVVYTYLLTPWCRVLLEKLTGLQLVKKFPAFYGTRKFITALTSVRHLSLSCASPIQSTYPHPTSWRSILILSTHLPLGLPSGLFPSGFS